MYPSRLSIATIYSFFLFAFLPDVRLDQCLQGFGACSRIGFILLATKRAHRVAILPAPFPCCGFAYLFFSFSFWGPGAMMAP
jgi:hypothetical protein